MVPPSQECNCSFARQIDERALRSETISGTLPDQFRKFIIVYGQNRVRIVDTKATDKISLVETFRRELGEDVRSKEINFVGGIMDAR
jgi:hypothetical protein